MKIVLPRLPLLRCALVLVFALPFALLSQPAGTPGASPLASAQNAKKTHTITITFANGAFSYAISPAQNDSKKARIKRGETINWVYAGGKWSVFFKNNTTPLVDAAGNPVATVSGGAGFANGAVIGVKHAHGASFSYGVRLEPTGGAPVVDDPEIIIDAD